MLGRDRGCEGGSDQQDHEEGRDLPPYRRPQRASVSGLDQGRGQPKLVQPAEAEKQGHDGQFQRQELPSGMSQDRDRIVCQDQQDHDACCNKQPDHDQRRLTEPLDSPDRRLVAAASHVMERIKAPDPEARSKDMDDEKRRKRQPRISGCITTQRETDGDKNNTKERHRSCPTAIERDGRDAESAKYVGLNRQPRWAK